MAAADGSGSLAGVRPTKGLLLFFTLLSLVYVGNSLETTENLEMLTKYYQGGFQEAAKKKAQLEDELASFKDFFQETIYKLSPIVKRLKAITEDSHYLRDLPTMVTEFLDEKIQEVNDDIQSYQNEIEEIWAFIELLDEKHEEL